MRLFFSCNMTWRAGQTLHRCAVHISFVLLLCTTSSESAHGTRSEVASHSFLSLLQFEARSQGGNVAQTAAIKKHSESLETHFFRKGLPCSGQSIACNTTGTRSSVRIHPKVSLKEVPARIPNSTETVQRDVPQSVQTRAPIYEFAVLGSRQSGNRTGGYDREANSLRRPGRLKPGQKRLRMRRGRINQPTDEEQVPTKDMTPEERAKYDRPPSVTLISIVGFCLLNLWQYTSLSMSRNIDELVGFDTPSFVTDMFAAAGRGMYYPPMIACMFLACRMHVLANTEGQAEPQNWTRFAMAESVCGQFLQYLLVVALAFVTHRHREHSALVERTAGLHDVHPRLGKHQFKYLYLKYVFNVFLWLSLIMTYTGLFAVMFGMYAFKRGQIPFPSPAFVATSTLTTLYIFAHLLVFYENPRINASDKSEIRQSKSVDRMQAFAISAVSAVKKAPMLAVLFLTCRLRAMQLDPWNGLPPEWVRNGFHLVVVAMFFEWIFAGAIGFTGKEEIGYYHHHIYKSYKWLHVLVQICNLASGFGLWSVYVALMTMRAPDGSTRPFPPTVHCILFLSFMYFTVTGFGYVFFFLKHVLDWDWKIMQNAALGAQASVQNNAMLATLFLAARLRAVQITNFTGSPQAWAQDAMYLCCFAAFVQTASTVALPVLSGNKAEFDEEGNTAFDLGPTWATYVVTTLKYFVIITLGIGMGIVVVSVFTITPETANYGLADSVFHQIEFFGWAILILVGAMFLTSGKVIGKIIAVVVQQLKIGGVRLQINSATIDVCNGYVNLKDLAVSNPSVPGVEYSVDAMIKIDNVVIRLHLGKLIRTLGKVVEIDQVGLKGLSLQADKPSCSAPSNLSVLLKNLKGIKKKPKKKPGPMSKCLDATGQKICSPFHREGSDGHCSKIRSIGDRFSAMSSCGGRFSGSTKFCGGRFAKGEDKEKKQEKEEKGKQTEVILHQLLITQITASVWRQGSPQFKLPLGKPISVDDFAEENFGIDEIVSLVLLTVVKTILLNTELIGKGLWKAVSYPCSGMKSMQSTQSGEAAQSVEELDVDELADSASLADAVGS